MKLPNEICLRYVYIIDVDNNHTKSRFYGKDRIFYTGQTNDILERFREHLHGVNSKFLNDYFKDARKNLVYVDYVFGNEYDAMAEEFRIKNLSVDKKKELIKSSSNKLVSYTPIKFIILKKYGKDDEEVCLKI